MGKFRPKTFGITVIAILSIVVILLFTTNSDGGIGALVPIPTLDIQTLQDGTRVLVEQEEGGGIFIIIEDPELESIACWVSQSATFRNVDGGVFATVKSDFLKSSGLLATPVASVVDVQREVELGSITTTPQIKCSTGKITSISGGFAPEEDIDPETAFDTVFPSFDQPLTVEKSFFTIRVYSSQPNNTWLEVFNMPYNVEKFDINSASHINLEPAIIQNEWIENHLPDGNYQTTYKLVYDGGFLMHWKQQGACTVDCANIPFIIPLVTDRTFTQGTLTNVHNEFEINRQLEVTVDGNNGGGTECDGVTESASQSSSEGCEPIPDDEQGCPQGQVKSGVGASAVCVDADGDPDDTINGGLDVKVKEVIAKFQTCLQSGQAECLASDDFLPFWIFGVGLIVILGAVAQRRQPEIYGVPT